ncbi:hypothetical protein [Streptacidiphilus sp. EB103A]|uniref:hypothetical protein n=1 Tax=Streptacidiphilus sp. EB103A TaxID=3156275 RepID=UPI0035156927
MAHPDGITWAGFIGTCLEVTGGSGCPVWADSADLIRHGVKQWTELPLWRTHSGVWSVDPSRAVASGFSPRPLVETIADTWAWLHGGGQAVPHPRAAEHGIAPAREQQLLAELNG